MGININDNPHIVLGLGDWAVGYGGGTDHHDNAVGFISFFPLESSVTELDTPVDPDNVIEIDDPAFSLVFADVKAAYFSTGTAVHYTLNNSTDKNQKIDIDWANRLIKFAKLPN